MNFNFLCTTVPAKYRINQICNFKKKMFAFYKSAKYIISKNVLRSGGQCL